MSKTKFLAFSCTHHPLEDPEAIEWLIDRIRHHEPDTIIHLGDGHEADSASRWPSEYDWTLSYEFERHNSFLREIRLALPKAHKVFLPGNHDDNILDINRINAKLRDLCDYRDHEPELAYWEQPCVYKYDSRGRYRINQVTFAHGFETLKNSNADQGLLLGMENGLFVSGHSHRPVDITSSKTTNNIPMRRSHVNVGTLRNMVDVPYMGRKKKFEWGQALVVGEAGDWRYSGSDIPNKPLWEAELEVLKMYDQ